MKTLSERDILFTAITGLTTGFVSWRVLEFLGTHSIYGFPTLTLIFIVPLLWLAGVQLGYFLGTWFQFFTQFGRFAAVGFTNAAVDFGVLYLFIGYTNYTSGPYFTLFKAVAFSVAVLHSYLWNRSWTFEQKQKPRTGEFSSFAIVAIVSLLVNVGIASFVVALPHDAIDPKVWAGVAAVVGSAAALIFSFVGFRLLVFKR